jgi:hypothetical protein
MDVLAHWRTAGDTLADVALRYLHREAHSGELLRAVREWKESVPDPEQTRGAVAPCPVCAQSLPLTQPGEIKCPNCHERLRAGWLTTPQGGQ